MTRPRARAPQPAGVLSFPTPPVTFESLLGEVLESAYNTALRLTRSGSDGEDLVHDTAMLACRDFAGYERGTSFRVWFYRIMLRRFFTHHRRSRLELVAFDFDDTPDLFLYARSHQAGLPTAGPDPAAELFERLGPERVQAAIDRLPLEYRVVTTLWFIEDFTYGEIAGMLDCPVGTVRSRLQRGRKMLQKTLWQVAIEAGLVGGDA